MVNELIKWGFLIYLGKPLDGDIFPDVARH